MSGIYLFYVVISTYNKSRHADYCHVMNLDSLVIITQLDVRPPMQVHVWQFTVLNEKCCLFRQSQPSDPQQLEENSE